MSTIFKVKYHRVLHSGHEDHKLYGLRSEYDFMLMKASDHEEAETNTMRELEQEDDAELFSLEIILIPVPGTNFSNFNGLSSIIFLITSEFKLR